jgi:hypothetical protein
MSESNVRITLRQQQDYQFQVDFGEGIPPLLADEPAPLGTGQGLPDAVAGGCREQLPV